jgi:hypothetical protein
VRGRNETAEAGLGPRPDAASVPTSTVVFSTQTARR